MKRLFLPLVLLTVAVICLSVVHIDNVNKINTESEKLRKKYQIKSGEQQVNKIETIDAEES
ncbi:hypothetical protein HN014_17080 [Aquimarina sp. TRL1]|uniref:hypothetical protein n=1 Tax=Aquimarina sp. (strain TRL1) TaxID=2736252 RepID=UPI00158E076E|nr:hypothetical protein [Aquimarina sp. TRL1]QKX06553.1 hypothetical protein HN014_17080 [Aquimarina sp. TRL1]